MKRSELLAVLESLLLETEDQLSGHRSDSILSGLEKAGMLPPPRELENVTGRVKYYYCHNETAEDVSYHTDPKIFWEPE